MSAYGFGALALSGAYWHGDGSISGEARLNGTPSELHVVAVRRDSQRVAGRAVSDSGGVFSISYLSRSEGGSPVEYTVIAVDNSGNTNAAVQDWVRVAGETPRSGIPAGDDVVLDVSDGTTSPVTIAHAYVS